MKLENALILAVISFAIGLLLAAMSFGGRASFHMNF